MKKSISILCLGALLLTPSLLMASNQTVVVIPIPAKRYLMAKWQGEWETGAMYKANDAIRYAGGSYLCLETHTADLTTAPDLDTAKWSLVAAGGDQGEAGEVGARGPVGLSGPRGSTGSSGSKGATGPTGPAGPAGADSTVPGATGPTGPAGPQGIQGPAGTVAGLGNNTNKGYLSINKDSCVIGQIILSAGASIGLPCSGQFLPIANFPVLYAVIGDKFGGDGRTNFRLPDLSSVAPDNTTYSICTDGIFPTHE